MTNSIADAKIHILYFVDAAPGVSYQMLMDKCMESLYVDFFAFTQAYEELISGNLMDKSNADNGMGEAIGGTETITLTEGGRAVLNDLKCTLNNKLAGYLEKASEELKVSLENLRLVTATFEPAANGLYVAHLSTIKNDRPCKIDLTCDSKESAEMICRNWRKNSKEVLNSVKSILGQ